ncbi:YcaO-like family protein [Hyalangium rubrum]|uniref:YcaO-like family protein n=1 Tax=Hyalangium rubrum TaxID=3103134 RepID=A0ABU5GWQ0_9BACT|nr:YcaO-like family protein [Hyalangium sp. s54d21]MDY7225623.1 YcaO-like family protein [Hyalangium sp. s54d21]
MDPTKQVVSQVFQQRLAQALGVTRVARVTGLDRTGVEVACAVRPGGHVLQVCNGKGASFEQAALGALFETAELWSAEHVSPGQLAWGSRAELHGRPIAAWSAEALGSAGRLVDGRLWTDSVRCAWREATELHSGRKVWVPAQGVHCPPSDAVALGPVSVAWTSNGSGAHPDARRALLHALLEATERDQLARALPGGWTEEAVRRRLLGPVVLGRGAPRAAALARSLRERGFEVHLFDVTPTTRTPGTVGLPVGAAVLVDVEEGPVPLTAGYACALGRDEALLKALLEAAQSRLTDIHGAREDVSSADKAAARAFAQACASVRPKRHAEDMPDFSADASSPVRGLQRVLNQLRRAGFTQVAAVTLDPPVPGLHVRRVVVPGMRISELL